MIDRSPSAGSAGRASWEACLERGRREEKSGRMAGAERAYLEALRANPDFNSLEREFARFLESRGRPEEAEAHLLRAMALGWPRVEGEAALARLREKSSAAALIADRRFEEAARALTAAAPGEGDALCPEVFSALLCARKYREAFGLADAMLGKSAQIPLAHKSLWPWWHALSSRGSAAKNEFCVRELARLRDAGAGGEFGGWFAYCRGVLLLNLNRNAEGMAEYERVRRLCPPRHAMLHYPFVLCLLGAGDFKGAIAAFEALLDRAPGYWWLRCRLGEARMAGGDVAGGLEEFARAENEVELYARQSILTWHGAALLWAGEYRRAAAKLDEAAGLGTRIWVHCWRGAAYLKLGERRKALADLDAAIEADPQDLEAHLWRGEANRLMGRSAEALRDLDRALALDPDYAWGYFNRALARGAAGDEKGLADDFAKIPDDVVAALRAPGAGAPGPEEMRAILEKGLERAGGIRRPEHYFHAIWMRRGKTSAPQARSPEAAARALRKAGGARLGEALHEWPDVFSELLCARKYREAFRLGDAMLEKSARLPSANAFLWPWWSKVSSRGSARKMEFCARELGRLRKAGKNGGFPGWFAYCRGVLLIGLGRDDEALAEYERVKRLPPARYALLHHPFVMNRLLAGDLERTIAACRALLKHAPEYWWFQCRMAEAFMAGGDVARGLREFDRAAAAASDAWSRRAIVTWHGAALLWAGEYRRAAAKLDEAAGLGSRVWVRCWRGAAYLKLGERRKALADLDAAIEADPQDLEAHLWRGEANRLMGRSAEALRDLDRALALDPDYAWGYFNRALARGAAGDEKGLADDFAKIPDDVVAALRAPGAGAPGPKEMRAILKKGLARAGGIRRPERYLNSIWMGRGGPAARRARG